MAERWAHLRRGNSVVPLCTNPRCTNKDPEQFTEKEVFGEDETTTIMQCLLCGDETPKDEWEFTKSALFQNPEQEANRSQRDAENQEVRQVSYSATSETRLLYDVNRSTDCEYPGLALDGHADGNADDITRQLADLSVPESGHMTRKFSIDSIGEIISLTPCTMCKEMLTKVSGSDDELALWHCAKCDAYYGVDDSFTMMDMYHTMSLLSESLQNATLRTAPCPGQCGNDDPEKFVFDFIDDEVYLICQVCSQPQLIHQSDDQPETSPEPSPSKSVTQIQIRCDCGNDHPEAFSVHYHSSGKPAKLVCLVCDEELIIDMELAKDEDFALGDLNGEATYLPPKGRTEIKDVSTLAAGDHIAWHQSLAYWHHAIVVTVGEISGKVKVIHYNGPDKSYGGKGVILEQWQEIDLKKEAVYRVDYHKCCTTEVVLERACSRLKEAKYSLLCNNCEHFAQWCKTGVARSMQVESFADTLVHIKNRIVAYASKDKVKTGIRMAKAVAKKYREMGTAASSGLAKASTDVAKGEASKVASSFGKLDYAAIGLVIAIEGVRTYRDIGAMHQKKERGDISQKEFVRFSVKRSFQGVGGVTGTVAGGALGQVIIPVPILGSLIGATLGAFIGEGLGTLAGRVGVSLIDGK